MSTIHDILVIGGGPAGYTAAIYAARANMAPLLLEGPQPGGQLMITSEVENFPGFPHGIDGPALMTQMREQAERYGTTLQTEIVTGTDLAATPKKVVTEKGEYLAHSVIIATGASARWLGLESETRLRGAGLSACATCDGFFFRNKAVAVIGGGDTAFEEALYLANLCSKVYLIHRRNEFRASKIMVERAKAHEKIEFVTPYTPVEFVGEPLLTGIKLQGADGEERLLEVQGAFIAIGHVPNTAPFVGQLPLDETGYIVADGVKTSIPGVFAAGDVSDKVYRQAVTAAGEGCKAALEAERYVAAMKHAAVASV